MLAMSRTRETVAPHPGWERTRCAPEAGGQGARETFRVGEGGRLVVAAGSSSVRVVARETDRVRVEAQGPGPLAHALLELEQEGDDVYVSTSSPPGPQWLRAWQRSSLTLEVSVPARYSVDVETRDGSVRIENVSGAVEVRSLRGRLVFQDVAGSIEARTRSGAIAVERCSGDLELRSVSGSIRIEGAAACGGRGAAPRPTPGSDGAAGRIPVG